MIRRKAGIVATALLVAAAVGVGTGLAAKPANPTTPNELVQTYDQLANAILGTKNAETHLVRAIVTDAHDRATAAFDEAASSLNSGNAADAAAALERAAQAIYLISQEGDKAVAAVRNRLLEGGHHHHATAEIAEKYPPGFVVITKESQKALVAASKDVARLASNAAETTVDAVAAARKSFEETWQKALE